MSKPTEFHLDAWKRFERAVDVVAKSPPQHKMRKKKSPKLKDKTIILPRRGEPK
jgi:hypothetical protein